MSHLPKVRLQELVKLKCSLYGHSYNPTCVRTGNWVLRQRLRGPALADYYPPRVATVRDVRRVFRGWDTYDEAEEDRLDYLEARAAKGKGPPKKKRTAEESKTFGKKKKR